MHFLGGLKKIHRKKHVAPVSKLGKHLFSFPVPSKYDFSFFTEIAESHFTISSSLGEKRNITENEQKQLEEDKSQNTEERIKEIISVIEVPNHLNGSLKIAVSSEAPQVNDGSSGKVDAGNNEKEEETPHSLLKWPSKSSKLTKVRKLNYRIEVEFHYLL